MDCIARRAPLGDHGHPVTELDQAFRSGHRIVVDNNATALEGMAMGKYETHHPTLASGSEPMARFRLSPRSETAWVSVKADILAKGFDRKLALGFAVPSHAILL